MNSNISIFGLGHTARKHVLLNDRNIAMDMFAFKFETSR